MRITVVGAGGVGGYFGGRLAMAGQEVAFLARGPHLAAIRQRGLQVRSAKGDFTAVVSASDNPADLGPSDVVLFCVKSYDTDAAATRLGPLLTGETAVVSLQNGIDNEERIAAVIGPGQVVGGAAYIFSSISDPGTVAHTGGPARLVFGELDGTVSARIERLRDACLGAGIDCGIPTDIRTVLWTKYAFICATAGMTAAARLPLGGLRDCAESWTMFRRIVAEIVELAHVEGVALGDDAVEQQVRFAASLDPNSFSSLHHDLVTGRRMELEALHGTAVRRAAQLGIATPANEAIYAILRPWALHSERRVQTVAG